MLMLHLNWAVIIKNKHNKGVHKFPDLQQYEVYDHVFQKSKSVLTIATAEV